MIVMNLEVDNLFAFKNFKMNFSYPKKIVNSPISGEFLETKPNFRYKKLNVLMGSNASGKTSVGRVLMAIFNFISKKESAKITQYMSSRKKQAYFMIDFLVDDQTLYRVRCDLEKKVSQEKENIKETIEVFLEIKTAKIGVKDSYETCVEKLKNIVQEEQVNEIGEMSKLDNMPDFGWLFTFPDIDAKHALLLKNDKNTLKLEVLQYLLKALDCSIESVTKSTEIENTYLIKIKDEETVLIRNGEIEGKSILSSGTREGIEIAYIISSICKNANGFYYCDEKFSYIQSDIEIALLSLMIELLHPNAQLFFTTHNLDLLDMDLPKHSFHFLKKKADKTIEIIDPTKYIKKNDRTLKNAVKNDIFDMAPDTSFIYDIAGVCKDEK